MSLDKYKEKRDFSKTSEPKGHKNESKRKLIFVVQKHAASHLHYDFRIEVDGVLKSWAVPKGPSSDPSQKRLAMMVEDHPYDYHNFEGIIPAGQYGAGTVIVWDDGYYEAVGLEDKSKKEQEKSLSQQLQSGSLKIRLHGQKLQGEFALVHTKSMGENAWLLIKHKDAFSSSKDILKDERSVKSGKTLDEVKFNSESTKSQIFTSNLFKDLKSSSIPKDVKPMLATLVNKPFDSPDWLYEVKLDGYRALAFLDNNKINLLSRNNKLFNDKFYPIVHVLAEININAVLDGEIIVLDKNGISDFSALQNWRSEVDGELAYVVFDILWYEGKELIDLPFVDRHRILTEVLPFEDDRLRLSETFDVDGVEMLNVAAKLGLEGIMAKRKDSVYVPGSRSKEWLKIKTSKRQEVVIGGYTKNEDSPKLFSSLLLGVFEHGVFKYAGKVGTGFSDKLQKEMMEQFESLIIKESPFDTEPDVNQPSRFRPKPPTAKAIWLKPVLVCEVAFTERTKDGVFRHPSFKGMRYDKDAKDVTLEEELNTDNVIEKGKKSKSKSPMSQKRLSRSASEGKDLEKKLTKAPQSDHPKTLLNPKEDTQVKEIQGHELKFNNLQKIYWPDMGISKGDMLNYYYQIAEYIIPYLKDRPQSLNRFPNGIEEAHFYQKDVKGKAPGWAKTFPYTTSDGEEKEYLVGKDEATLLWMASLGCIEMNPWFSRIHTPDNPDYCVLDLDPDKNTFEQVIQAAITIKEILDEVNVPCYCKTSGSTGIHIYIPLQEDVSYDQSQLLAKLIVTIAHKRLPDFTSLERLVKNRKGKMYLDFLQNRPSATIACPYSLRPKPGATVSMPLRWDEVKPGLKMRDFNIKNAVDRARAEGDHFEGVLQKGINLEKTLENFQNAFDIT